jgi:hypothetical protein
VKCISTQRQEEVKRTMFAGIYAGIYAGIDARLQAVAGQFVLSHRQILKRRGFSQREGRAWTLAA